MPGGMEDQPPYQPEEKTQQFLEDKPNSPRTIASNLLGGRGQLVKRKKLASDKVASLDCFCKSTRRIEELKLDAAIKLHKNYRN